MLSRFFCKIICLVMLSIAIIVSGCNPHVVKKEIKPLVDRADAYSVISDGAKPHERWWEAFNDSYLDLLISEALSDNLTLMQAKARIEQSIAAEKNAASFLYPELNAAASGRQEWRGEGKPDDTARSGLKLSWEIDLWDRLSSARNSAGYEVLADREDLEATAVLIAAQVADTYYRIIEQDLQMALLDSQIKVGKTLLELIELRFGYGEASVVDVFQQRQQLASTRAQVPVVRSRLRTLYNRLYVQLGRSPVGHQIGIAGEFPELPVLPDTGVPLDLLKNRPDLRRIYNRMIALDYRIAEAVADRLPKLEINSEGGVRDRLANDGLFLSLLLEAAAPVIDWERRAAEIEKREAVLREELALYSEAYLEAIEEVENALWQERYQKDLIRAMEEQIGIARSNLTETRNRYRQGLTDYLPVLTALQSLQRLEREILSRQRELISIRILLYRAIGGFRITADSHKPDDTDHTIAVNITGDVIE